MEILQTKLFSKFDTFNYQPGQRYADLPSTLFVRQIDANICQIYISDSTGYLVTVDGLPEHIRGITTEDISHWNIGYNKSPKQLTYSNNQLKLILQDNTELPVSIQLDITTTSVRSLNFEDGVFKIENTDGSIISSNVNLDQRYVQSSPKDQKYYVRSNSQWVEIPSPLDPKLVKDLGNVNLDTITIPGIYRQNRGQFANVTNHYPSDNIRGGSLYVIPISEDPKILHQLYITGGTTSVGSNTTYYYEVPRIFLRKWIRSQKWTEWFELSSTKRILTQSDSSFTTDDQIEQLSQYDATVILPEAPTTITVNKGKRTTITYLATSTHPVTIVQGDRQKVINPQIGQEIKVTITENKSYLNLDYIPVTEGKRILLQDGTTTDISELNVLLNGTWI